MDRPKGISVTALLMSVCNAMGWFIVDWAKPHAGLTFSIFTLLIAVGYVFVWFYWKGRNWARIAVLLTSVLGVYNLRYFSPGNPVRTVMVVSEALLSIFLLWWLNTRPVRAYFRQRLSPAE
jgi:hypothetical protein